MEEYRVKSFAELHDALGHHRRDAGAVSGPQGRWSLVQRFGAGTLHADELAESAGMQLLSRSDLLVMVSPALVTSELNAATPALRKLNIDKPTIRRHASLIYPRKRPMTAQAELLLEEVRIQAKKHSASNID